MTFEVRAPAGEKADAAALELVEKVLAERLKQFEPALVGVQVSAAGDAVLVELRAEPNPEQVAALEARVETSGAFAILPVVQPDSLEPGAADQRETMLEWRAAHPEGTAAEFNATPPELGGPLPTFRWFSYRQTPERWLCCDVTGLASPATRFTESDLDPAGLRRGRAPTGYPCIYAEPLPVRAAHLLTLTTPWVDGQIACVLGDELLTAAFLTSALGGSFPLEDRFTEPERDALLDVLRAAALHGRLPFKPVLKRVMPTAK
ncbi:MAG: hypothetical protein NTV21_14405 [Planctomycetota bacterium]|nr:hypothetical protein [Planctomycetota bacterium]